MKSVKHVSDGKTHGARTVADMKRDERLNKFHKASAVGYLLCNTPVNAAFVTFFAMFSFANPDPEECWANDEYPQYVKQEEEAEYKNMALRFRIWFYIGFAIYSLMTIIDLFHAFGICLKFACCIDTW